ncbi:MAG: hypothetical protein IGS48_00990 [Oscillatoriales cyanobacterium C42_A2020_001]|nr:hypothetical protein [Leptolyngbyaceae cyanobacterium C42_A2020_001]
MSHPGRIGGFPGNWSFQGEANLVVECQPQKLMVSLNLEFIEKAEIDVWLIGENVSDNDRLGIAFKMYKSDRQTLIIRNSIFLIGISKPPLNTKKRFLEFIE